MTVPLYIRLQELGERAVRLEGLRLERKRVRDERLPLGCGGRYDDAGRATGWPDGQPCWKQWEPDPDDTEREVRVPEERWCDSCRQRQRVHEAYLEVSKRHRAAKGAFTKLCTRLLREKEAAEAARAAEARP